MSTILERLAYGFDRDSRRTWRKRALTTGEDNTYGYDGLSQVVNAARGNLNLNATAIGGVPAEAQAWDYDPTGNWRGYETQASGNPVLDQRRVHDKGNRLTQIEGAPNPVLLDRAGRMREVAPDAGGNWNESQQVKWDAWSRVTQVRRKSDGAVLGIYTYDGLTRRLTRTLGSNPWHSYYSDAWRPLEERRDSQTTAALQYYWGARHRDDLVRRDRATTSGGFLDETRYVLMDYYSPAAITDTSGAVTERYAFSAFGLRRILAPDWSARSSSECDWEFAFQGQFLDADSGLYNYGYRYFSAYLGRWLSRDPIEESGGINLYSYVLDNPINVWDPLGLDGYTQTGNLSIDTDTRSTTTVQDKSHQNRLAPGSAGNRGPGVVAPQEAKGVQTGDPAILTTNGKSVVCTVFDRSTGRAHKHKPEANEAAVKAAGLDVKPSKQGPYPSAGKGDAAVPASIYFPTANGGRY